MKKNIKILIVEDEALTAMALKLSLQQVGYEVCEPVASGESAIQMVKEEQPDVLLMDIRLAGDTDGIEAAKEIYSHTDIRIPVIFMTGYSDQATIERVKTLKPLAYLVKPVNPEQVKPVIAALFDRRDQTFS